MKSRVVELHHIANDVVYIDVLKLGWWHFREIAEAADDGLQVRQLREESRRALAKYFVKFRG